MRVKVKKSEKSEAKAFDKMKKREADGYITVISCKNCCEVISINGVDQQHVKLLCTHPTRREFEDLAYYYKRDYKW